MQTLDVRIKLTPRVVRETYCQFERREEVEVGEGGDDRGIYDRIQVRKEWGRHLEKSELRDSSDSFSSNSCSHASEDTGGSAKKTSRNFFKLKMPLKCLNKVTNFSLFK